MGFLRGRNREDRATGKSEWTMKFQMSNRNRRLLDEFLERLLSEANRKEGTDSSVEDGRRVSEAAKHPGDGRNAMADPVGKPDARFDVFRMRPDGIVRIGFVQGIEDAKKLLPRLNSKGGGVYFVFDTSTDKVVLFERVSADKRIESSSDSPDDPGLPDRGRSAFRSAPLMWPMN